MTCDRHGAIQPVIPTKVVVKVVSLAVATVAEPAVRTKTAAVAPAVVPRLRCTQHRHGREQSLMTSITPLRAWVPSLWRGKVSSKKSFTKRKTRTRHATETTPPTETWTPFAAKITSRFTSRRGAVLNRKHPRRQRQVGGELVQQAGQKSALHAHRCDPMRPTRCNRVKTTTPPTGTSTPPTVKTASRFTLRRGAISILNYPRRHRQVGGELAQLAAQRSQLDALRCESTQFTRSSRVEKRQLTLQKIFNPVIGISRRRRRMPR